MSSAEVNLAPSLLKHRSSITIEKKEKFAWGFWLFNEAFFAFILFVWGCLLAYGFDGLFGFFLFLFVCFTFRLGERVEKFKNPGVLT